MGCHKCIYNDTFYIFGGVNTFSTVTSQYMQTTYFDCNAPTMIPTTLPTNVPTILPSNIPSTIPTIYPTNNPTILPSHMPSNIPTIIPTNNPTIVPPTDIPTTVPSKNPTNIPTVPTSFPTAIPTESPTTVWTYFNDTIFPNMADYVISDSVYQLANISEEGNTAILKIATLHTGTLDADTYNLNDEIEFIYQLVSLQEEILTVLVNYTNNYLNEYMMNSENVSNYTVSTSAVEETIVLISSIAKSSYMILNTYFEARNGSLKKYLPNCCIYNESIIFSVLSVLDSVVESDGYHDYINNKLEYVEVVNNDTLTLYLFEVMSNMMSLMSYSDVFKYNNSVFGNVVIEWINYMGNLVLIDRNVGDFYEFSSFDSFNVKFAKIDRNNYDECQINNNLLLSNELLNIKSSFGENNMNCILMTTYYNIYNISSQLSQTNFVSFELNNDNIYTFSSFPQQRAAEADEEEEEEETVWLSDCEPIIITYNSSNYNESWWEDNNYPECSFYNVTTESYIAPGY